MTPEQMTDLRKWIAESVEYHPVYAMKMGQFLDEIDRLQNDYDVLKRLTEEINSERHLLRKALKYYADNRHAMVEKGALYVESGETARKALKEATTND